MSLPMLVSFKQYKKIRDLYIKRESWRQMAIAGGLRKVDSGVCTRYHNNIAKRAELNWEGHERQLNIRILAPAND